jgi:hypothetical protein
VCACGLCVVYLPWLCPSSNCCGWVGVCMWGRGGGGAACTIGCSVPTLHGAAVPGFVFGFGCRHLATPRPCATRTPAGLGSSCACSSQERAGCVALSFERAYRVFLGTLSFCTTLTIAAGSQSTQWSAFRPALLCSPPPPPPPRLILHQIPAGEGPADQARGRGAQLPHLLPDAQGIRGCGRVCGAWGVCGWGVRLP